MSTSTPTVTVRHLGGDRLRIQVRGHELLTDQPVEEGGEDTAPTPTELFLASLAACVEFYAERFLRRHELPTEGLAVTCDWEWAHSPMRVGRVELTVDAPGLLPERYQAFERVIEHCTIHNTLRQPPEVRFKVLAAKRMSAA
jgi:putative redox protein